MGVGALGEVSPFPQQGADLRPCFDGWMVGAMALPWPQAEGAGRQLSLEELGELP